METVDYQPFETGNFPPPTTPEEVGARVLMEERLQEDDGDIEMQIESDDEDSQDAPSTGGAVKLSQMENRIGIHMKDVSYQNQSSKKDNTQVQDMDEASSDEESPSTTKMQPPVAPLMPPTHDKVVVKKYDPKAAQVKPPKPAATDEFLISPITGEKIPASKVAEHMRIGLLDPRWVEQRDKHTVEKINQENVYAAGTAIEASLKQLAERRTDIFGVGDEETVIGKKLGEEETKKDDRVTWDGHTSSVEAATRAARANITLEDQIHQIHKVIKLNLSEFSYNNIKHILETNENRLRVFYQMKKKKKLDPNLSEVNQVVVINIILICLNQFIHNINSTSNSHIITISNNNTILSLNRHNILCLLNLQS